MWRGKPQGELYNVIQSMNLAVTVLIKLRKAFDDRVVYAILSQKTCGRDQYKESTRTVRHARFHRAQTPQLPDTMSRLYFIPSFLFLCAALPTEPL